MQRYKYIGDHSLHFFSLKVNTTKVKDSLFPLFVITTGLNADTMRYTVLHLSSFAKHLLNPDSVVGKSRPF